MPAAASDACSLSSDIVRTCAANSFASSGAIAAPRSGSVGKSTFENCRFSNTTVRATLSTCVRAVANTTPNAWSPEPSFLNAIAARKSSWLPVQLLTCGW